tara:strand:+ start:434 stop:691 length:258 start_codon:yes stop_codon:yes gene_type:complete
MTVREAQERIRSDEFAYWMAYLGEHCLDKDGWEQTALLCAVTANSQGAKMTPDDFMPVRKRKQQKEQTPEQMLSVMETMFGGSPD